MNQGPSKSYYFSVPTMMCYDSCVPLMLAILNPKHKPWIEFTEAGFPGQIAVEGEGWVRVSIKDNSYNAQSVIDAIANESKDRHYAVEAVDPSLKKKYGVK